MHLNKSTGIISKELIHYITENYAQDPFGRHGLSHWARVLEIGRRLVVRTGADPVVVELFSVFHDSKRETESLDPGHGKRGAEFAGKLLGDLYHITDKQYKQLHYACRHHTDGLTKADVTIQVCWDSDRLDLGRANITPSPEKLCTEAAKDMDMISWAHQRSCDGVVSSLIECEWGISEL